MPAAQNLVFFSVLQSSSTSRPFQNYPQYSRPPHLDRSPALVREDCLLPRTWFTFQLSCPCTCQHISYKMGKTYKSRAKTNRSVLRLLNFKQAYLEDLWDCEIKIDTEIKDIVWKASDNLNLTLKKNIRIVETIEFYNPAFAFLTVSQKLSKFQNMWEPIQDSFSFFACVHDHLKRNSTRCTSYCHGFSSPNCGRLVYFLSTSKWPDG